MQTTDGWKRKLTEVVKQTRFTVDGKPVEWGVGLLQDESLKLVRFGKDAAAQQQ